MLLLAIYIFSVTNFYDEYRNNVVMSNDNPDKPRLRDGWGVEYCIKKTPATIKNGFRGGF